MMLAVADGAAVLGEYCTHANVRTGMMRLEFPNQLVAVLQCSPLIDGLVFIDVFAGERMLRSFVKYGREAVIGTLMQIMDGGLK